LGFYFQRIENRGFLLLELLIRLTAYNWWTYGTVNCGLLKRENSFIHSVASTRNGEQTSENDAIGKEKEKVWKIWKQSSED